MDHVDVGRYWNDNAEVWTQLTRAGYDKYRDVVNTPGFLAMLPDVQGREGLDIGCGEGHNTRLLAARGAKMSALDISEVFIGHARAEEARAPLGIAYRVASAVEVPYPDASFDFATAFMSLMDIPEKGRVFAEAWRVLRPGGFLQFSIEHPCYATPHRRNLRDADGQTYAMEVGGYFRGRQGQVEEWIFNAAPVEVKAGLRRFRVPRFTLTLSAWFNLLLESGFVIERVGEPSPTDEEVQSTPYVQDAQVLAYFLHVRVRKPG